LIGVDEALAREAGQLADDQGLRGYDAVHLACALALDGDETALVTWDVDLRQAADRLGLSTGGSPIT
jgi:predicted nucleic acid-binding protein